MSDSSETAPKPSKKERREAEETRRAEKIEVEVRLRWRMRAIRGITTRGEIEDFQTGDSGAMTVLCLDKGKHEILPSAFIRRVTVPLSS